MAKGAKEQIANVDLKVHIQTQEKAIEKLTGNRITHNEQPRSIKRRKNSSAKDRRTWR